MIKPKQPILDSSTRSEANGTAPAPNQLDIIPHSPDLTPGPAAADRGIPSPGGREGGGSRSAPAAPLGGAGAALLRGRPVLATGLLRLRPACRRLGRRPCGRVVVGGALLWRSLAAAAAAVVVVRVRQRRRRQEGQGVEHHPSPITGGSCGRDGLGRRRGRRRPGSGGGTESMIGRRGRHCGRAISGSKNAPPAASDLNITSRLDRREPDEVTGTASRWGVGKAKVECCAFKIRRWLSTRVGFRGGRYRDQTSTIME